MALNPNHNLTFTEQKDNWIGMYSTMMLKENILTQSQQVILVNNHLSLIYGLLKILLSVTLFYNILIGQTKSQVDQAKKAFIKSGMTSKEAKAFAKSKGYSDQQIEKVINDERDSKNTT